VGLAERYQAVAKQYFAAHPSIAEEWEAQLHSHKQVKLTGQDENGFYLATIKDFEDAKRLFTDRDAEELVKKLTRKEKEVVQLLVDHPNGLTYEEIAVKLKPPVSTGRVIHIIKGKDGKSGLFQKLPIKETKRSDTTKNTEEDG
jgi:DNA-binding NarL/FixJ family response regulator